MADHIRTLSLAIADGIEPGNKERNSVLRRILRRAVRYGRTLGFHEPFFYKLANVLAETMGQVFPEIRLKLEHVEEVIKREEVAFNRTLDRGLALFEEEISSLQTLVSSSGRQAEGSNELEAAIVLKSEAKLSNDERQQQRRKQRKELALNRCVTGEAAFVLSDTYGFPID